MAHYILASNRPWALNAFAARRPELPGNWHVVTSPADLKAVLALVQPRYVFFPHWSHIVPPEIFDAVECVCFHMTDVPYGRGGSPLQNLIVRGHQETKLTALRMSQELDGGPVYCKQPLSLDGSAKEIFERAAVGCMDIISDLVKLEPAPKAQEGDAVSFKRRGPDESALPFQGTVETLFDHIRMLDAPGYPQSFVDSGNFRLKLSNATMENGILTTTTQINYRPIKDGTDVLDGNVSLRRMNLADTRIVYEWRYSSGSEKFYKSKEIPNYTRHVSWIESTLNMERIQLLIGEIGFRPVSHIRFDENDGETEISIYVDPNMRGMRIGEKSLQASVNYLRERGENSVTANVNKENSASKRLFLSCGFKIEAERDSFLKMKLVILS